MNGLSITKSLELMLVRPSLSHSDVEQACQLALEYRLAAVCVFPVHVATAASVLARTPTQVVASIGFPFGQDTVPAKLIAIEQAQSDGADEMCVMIDHTPLTGSDPVPAIREIDRICSSVFWSSLVTTRGRSQLTITMETMLVSEETLQPVLASLEGTPVGFLQTSGGHQPRAITDDHVQLLRHLLPADVSIKAVGAIATLTDAQDLLGSGAVRIGSSAAIAIAQEEAAALSARRPGREATA